MLHSKNPPTDFVTQGDQGRLRPYLNPSMSNGQRFFVMGYDFGSRRISAAGCALFGGCEQWNPGEQSKAHETARRWLLSMS